MKARSILWDLFGDHLRDLDDGRVRLRALCELLGVFGIGESTARVVVARMRREGWFSTSRDGRQTVYAITERSLRMLDQGRTRIFQRGDDDWDGLWRTVIYAVPEPDRAVRERLRKTLSWYGFGPLAVATWISPHPRLDDVTEALADLPATRIFLLESRSRGREADREMAARCWSLDRLDVEYDDLIDSYRRLPPASELAGLRGPDALRLQVELVAAYRTLPFRDPDLPAALLPAEWPGRRAHALFLAAHDALHAPARRFVCETLAHEP